MIYSKEVYKRDNSTPEALVYEVQYLFAIPIPVYYFSAPYALAERTDTDLIKLYALPVTQRSSWQSTFLKCKTKPPLL